MVTVFDYTASTNNCFVVKHLLEDYVQTVTVDTENKTLTIEYHVKQNNIPSEKTITLEEYNRFGLLTNITEYVIVETVSKTNSSITYKYQ